MRDLPNSGAGAIDARVLCCPGRESCPSRKSEPSQGSRGKWRWWTPGDGQWVFGWEGKASLEPRVPLVINSQDAMNDVELRIAQPLCLLLVLGGLSVQCRLGVYGTPPSRSTSDLSQQTSIVTRSGTVYIGSSCSANACSVAYRGIERDLLLASTKPTSLAMLTLPSRGTARH